MRHCPSWPKLLFCLIVVCGGAAASGETVPSDAYAEGVRAFERGDGTEAVGFFTSLAERDDPRAQFGLGLVYERGLGAVASDGPAALAWYRRAAGAGFSPAQNNLALLYAEGRVVPQDPARAVALWREAATAGYAPAQHNLGLALGMGSDTPRDAGEAAEWGRRAEAQRRATTAGGGPSPEAEGDASGAADGEAQFVRASAPVPIVAIVAGGRRPASILAGSLRPAAAPSPPPAAPPAGAFYVQLASLPRRVDAERESELLAHRHPDLLAAWRPALRAVDLGAKGVWHRVLFGPIAGKAQAKALCAQLRARGGACLVAPASSPG